jgi:hypothetical protein
MTSTVQLLPNTGGFAYTCPGTCRSNVRYSVQLVGSCTLRLPYCSSKDGFFQAAEAKQSRPSKGGLQMRCLSSVPWRNRISGGKALLESLFHQHSTVFNKQSLQLGDDEPGVVREAIEIASGLICRASSANCYVRVVVKHPDGDGPCNWTSQTGEKSLSSCLIVATSSYQLMTRYGTSHKSMVLHRKLQKESLSFFPRIRSYSADGWGLRTDLSCRGWWTGISNKYTETRWHMASCDHFWRTKTA